MSGEADPPTDNGGGDADDSMIEKEGSKRGLMIFVIVLAVVALAIAAVLAIEAWSASDDDDNLVPTDSTLPSSTSTGSQPTTVPESTVPETTVPASGEPAPSSTAPAGTAPDTTAPAEATTAPPASSAAPTTTVAPGDPLSQAVWPLPDSDIRYDDPVEAARGFAVDFVGFVAPAMGEFQAGDSRSGEVELRVGEVGPPTVVFLRQLSDDDTWWVTGSATDNIVVQRPDALETVQSPLTINGLARAFEGTVNVELRADGTDDPLFEGFVTGGGGSELEPFEETFEFDTPGEGGGDLVLVTFSPDNGNVMEAEVIRVFFAAA